MELIFYKGKGDWLDKGIRWWTWGEYSHAEIRFEEHLIFSSSWRDGGVRFRDLPIQAKSWDRLKIKIDPERAEKILQWCAERPGTPYDLWGILGFMIGRPIDHTMKWYCSEICAASLTKFWEPEFPRQISPNKLYQLAVQLPELFTPTTGTFKQVLLIERLAPAREIAADLLSLPEDIRNMELTKLRLDDLPMYAIVRDKFRELRQSVEQYGG